MARTLTVKDGYALINAIAYEALGANATVQAQDSSSFVSVGEMIIQAGFEQTLDAIGLVLGRTFIATRPYKAKFALINSINSGAYANRIRKISYYIKDALPTGADNTDLYTNFAAGYDNGTNSAASVSSMWEQNPPVPLELNFGGSTEWQYCITVYEHQLKVAFTDETKFIEFMNGIMTEVANDIETEKEAFARMTLLNAIGMVYDGDALYSTGSAINMTTAFNNWFGTSYTTTDLLSQYLTEFLEFFAATVKTVSDFMENRDIKYHAFPVIAGHALVRHTPKSRQKMLMLSDFWRKAEAIVKPQIFNPEYLDINNFEKILFWQNVNDPYGVSITPAIPDFDSTSPTYGTQIAGDPVALNTVLGFMFDEDAILVDFQLDDVYSTPVEARKRYRNLWHTIRKNAIMDLTEKMVLFYMADEGDGGDLNE